MCIISNNTDSYYIKFVRYNSKFYIVTTFVILII
jgi:hypothetical protein